MSADCLFHKMRKKVHFVHYNNRKPRYSTGRQGKNDTMRKNGSVEAIEEKFQHLMIVYQLELQVKHESYSDLNMSLRKRRNGWKFARQLS